MNLNLARKILRAIAERSDGCLELNNREMKREAELMQKEGWLQLSPLPGSGSVVVARLTDAGERVGRLFMDEAIAQRLRDAFSPPTFHPGP